VLVTRGVCCVTFLSQVLLFGLPWGIKFRCLSSGVYMFVVGHNAVYFHAFIWRCWGSFCDGYVVSHFRCCSDVAAPAPQGSGLVLGVLHAWFVGRFLAVTSRA
jgi:hypothetical protein